MPPPFVVHREVDGAWPQLVGKWHNGHVTEKKHINPGDLFHRLDNFLKTRKVRWRQLPGLECD